MARLAKRVTKKAEPEPQTDAVVGRELQKHYQAQNEGIADQLEVGMMVQYFDEGWRYGKVEKLPESDESRYGEVRIEHQITGRVWVDAREVKPPKMEWEDYFKWRRAE